MIRYYFDCKKKGFTLKFKDDDFEGGTDTTNLECNGAGFFFHQGEDFFKF